MPSFTCPECRKTDTEEVERRIGESGGVVYTVECRSCDHQWEVPF